jgi:hypothetical protein
MQDQNMIAGYGGLTNDFTGLVDGQDMVDMRNPQAIIGNMNSMG